jgi:hypothetical protein
MYDFKNKQANVLQNNRYMFAKTLSMFEYMGLPETIPYRELEKLLQNNGYAFITEVEGELYAFGGGLGGEQDVYGNPSKITINNVALNFNKTLDIKTDGVLIHNDDSLIGLLPLFNKYNSLLTENDINMVLNGYSNRLQIMLSATDDKTKASADKYIENLINGQISVISSSPMFDGVKTHTTGNSQGSSITTLIEYQQYIKAGLFNEIGLDANFNMKRERLTSGEVDQGDDILYPFIDNMMKCRLTALEQINEKYGLEISIDYGSVWNKKNKEMVDGIVDETLDETPDETLDETLDETPDETLDETLPEEQEQPEEGEAIEEDGEEEEPQETTLETDTEEGDAIEEGEEEEPQETTLETDTEEGDELSNNQPEESEKMIDGSSLKSSSELLDEFSNEKIESEINEIKATLENDELTEEEREIMLVRLTELQGAKDE